MSIPEISNIILAICAPISLLISIWAIVANKKSNKKINNIEKEIHRNIEIKDNHVSGNGGDGIVTRF